MIHSVKRNFCPAIDGLILIDCWDYSMHPMHEDKFLHLKVFYQNINNHIKKFNIRYVVNAMSQANTNQIDRYIDRDILSQIPHCTIETWDEFDHCLNRTLDRSVTQWYLAGQTWKICVHNNDIGLNRIARATSIAFAESQHELINDFDFYADQTSFRNYQNQLVEHNDFIEDTLQWQYLPWFGYKLIQY
jgi:hypothetical protein